MPRHLSICIRHLSVTLTIPLVENLNQHQAAIQALDQHFSVQKNVPLEQLIFHIAVEEANENIDQYVPRPRKVS